MSRQMYEAALDTFASLRTAQPSHTYKGGHMPSYIYCARERYEVKEPVSEIERLLKSADSLRPFIEVHYKDDGSPVRLHGRDVSAYGTISGRHPFDVMADELIDSARAARAIARRLWFRKP